LFSRQKKLNFGKMKKYLIFFTLILAFVVRSNAQPTQFYNLYFEGNSLLVKGQFAKAIECYNKALKLFEADYVYFNRGNAFYELKDYTKALADYNKTLILNKGYMEAYCQRGLLKLKTSDQTACDDLKKAIKGDLQDARNAYDGSCKKK
jgi:tetratricopeptide (TPR) repeat protein